LWVYLILEMEILILTVAYKWVCFASLVTRYFARDYEAWSKMAQGFRDIPSTDLQALVNAGLDRRPIKGLSHQHYRYPARFSPVFARRAIEIFTQPGELVLDPFMGGGTTLVEAGSLGRIVVGSDINSLAVFVATAKTTLITAKDIRAAMEWSDQLPELLNLKSAKNAVTTDDREYYQRHLHNSESWRLQRLLALGLCSLRSVDSKKAERLIRCALLATGQWAFDNRRELPSVRLFRDKLATMLRSIIQGSVEYTTAYRRAGRQITGLSHRRLHCLHRSAVTIHKQRCFRSLPSPRLVLTSPPYPGVHVLYHRWQIKGRRETPAPYWVAGCNDGIGSSHYTFGDRHENELTSYFDSALKSFKSIRQICDNDTIVLQLIAFSEPTWQLPRYLATMNEAGFVEVTVAASCIQEDNRIRREVPNRRWYAAMAGRTNSSTELLLIHKPA
jgi:hypothetical protein